jgi:hypothetical protein
MKTIWTVFMIISLSLFTVALAGDKNGEKPAPETRTIKKADAIYNEIMMTLTPEMKARIDSSRASTNKDQSQTGTADSARQKAELTKKNDIEKKNYIESLPDDVQLRVEKALREMEQRQKERTLEFKEIKRGKH